VATGAVVLLGKRRGFRLGDEEPGWFFFPRWPSHRLAKNLSAIGFSVTAMRAVSSEDASGATALRKASTFSQSSPSESG
jgi:hypothetical protein